MTKWSNKHGFCLLRNISQGCSASGIQTPPREIFFHQYECYNQTKGTRYVTTNEENNEGHRAILFVLEPKLRWLGKSNITCKSWEWTREAPPLGGQKTSSEPDCGWRNSLVWKSTLNICWSSYSRGQTTGHEVTETRCSVERTVHITCLYKKAPYSAPLSDLGHTKNLTVYIRSTPGNENF